MPGPVLQEESDVTIVTPRQQHFEFQHPSNGPLSTPIDHGCNSIIILLKYHFMTYKVHARLLIQMSCMRDESTPPKISMDVHAQHAYDITLYLSIYSIFIYYV